MWASHMRDRIDKRQKRLKLWFTWFWEAMYSLEMMKKEQMSWEKIEYFNQSFCELVSFSSISEHLAIRMPHRSIGTGGCGE